MAGLDNALSIIGSMDIVMGVSGDVSKGFGYDLYCSSNGVFFPFASSKHVYSSHNQTVRMGMQFVSCVKKGILVHSGMINLESFVEGRKNFVMFREPIR